MTMLCATVVVCAFDLISVFGASRAHTRYTSADGTPTATRTIDLKATTKAAAINIWAAQTESIPIDSTRWQFEGKTTVTEYLGRRGLCLQDGRASLNDFEMTDGVIDVDLAGSEVRGFYNIYFRTQEDGSGEVVYLRPHKSGLGDAQ